MRTGQSKTRKTKQAGVEVSFFKIQNQSDTKNSSNEKTEAAPLLSGDHDMYSIYH